ncbi:putative serine protease PepD [Marmoricola sp. OAE513]|uniref:S1C family serine protease n=1 Tax=Marmoricola sp. OAE513 TaxID=2817894 RepID=UPI001AE27D88
MSESDIPGKPDEQGSSDDEVTQPLAEQTPTEPTTPYEGLPTYAPPGSDFPLPATPPAPEEPKDAAPQASPAVPPPYESAYGAPYGTQPTEQLPQPEYLSFPPPNPYGGGYDSTPTHRDTRPGLPGWLWPLIAVLSLVVGILGGAIGGALVADNKKDDPGVLQVERRTAAPLADDNASVPAVAQKLLPSTVKIVAEYKGEAQGAAGSGWVFDEEGHVVTNNHVVAEAAEDDGPIDVIDQAGKHHKATVVGRSPVYDLAVLKVDDVAELPPVALGSADQMRVGETVIAVGSPLALSASVTSGIISALNRPVTTGDGDEASFINAIQTDAAINPGNSGGPLANLQGQVIGVNSAIATLGSSSQEGGNLGIGFAIPIEQVQVTVDQILRTGEAQYPVIGVTVKGNAKIDGAEVTEINSGTPAADSDLKVGDVITEVDGRPVTDQTDVVVAIRSHRVTDKVTLTIIRDGETKKIKVGLLAKTG